MEKTLERQIRFTNTATGNKMSYYHNLPIVDGYCPNYFWITPRGYLAQVFIEVVEGYTEKKCYAVMGANCFLEGDIMIECEGVRTPYIRNSIVYFDTETKQFVFEHIKVYYDKYEKSYFFNKGKTQRVQMKDCTKQYKQQIEFGVRKSCELESDDIGKRQKSSAYIPFAVKGELPRNTFYFGSWGKNYFGLYQHYYLLTDEGDSIKWELRMVPVITSEEFKDIDKSSCVMYIRLLCNDKKDESVIRNHEKYYYANSEITIKYDSESKKHFFESSYYKKYTEGGSGSRKYYIRQRGVTFLKEKVHY